MQKESSVVYKSLRKLCLLVYKGERESIKVVSPKKSARKSRSRKRHSRTREGGEASNGLNFDSRPQRSRLAAEVVLLKEKDFVLCQCILSQCV